MFELLRSYRGGPTLGHWHNIIAILDILRTSTKRKKEYLSDTIESKTSTNSYNTNQIESYLHAFSYYLFNR